MWRQITAIAWAQFRITRNHLPRTSVGTVLIWLLAAVWYGMYAALGVVLAIFLARVPEPLLLEWVPAGLLGVFLFWQIIPLFTLSTGWSLQLNKLQIYPVSGSALFGIEVVLRVTAAPEMLLVLAGAFAGLLRHPGIALWAPFCLFLFVPFNLFLSLAIREIILHSFERNRFRELFAILIISIGVIPQFLLRTELGRKSLPYFLAVARGVATPWHEVAKLSLGFFSAADLMLILLWTAASYALARWQFEKGLSQDEGFRASPAPMALRPENAASPKLSKGILDLAGRLFSDPLAALVQKEFQSLLRMPRFRVLFGMACIFSVLIFFPMALNGAAHNRHNFISSNFLTIATLYGLLLMSDALLMNSFGLDRRAAQIYFVAPISFGTVLKAKNLAAAGFIALQCLAVLLLGVAFQMFVTPFGVAAALLSAAVVGVFFLAAGNLVSVSMARPVDPTQTFRKQSGGKVQLWFLLCAAGMMLLVGFAFLARWALQTDWAFIGVLLIEFVVGLIVYGVATQSAVERGLRERERLIEALSKGSSVIGVGLS